MGWIAGTGEDNIGQYVEIEPADINPETYLFLLNEDQPAKLGRYYMGAILGISIYKQKRGQDSPFGRNWGDVLKEWAGES